MFTASNRLMSDLVYPGQVCSQPLSRLMSDLVYPGQLCPQPLNRLTSDLVYPGQVCSQPLSRLTSDLVYPALCSQPLHTTLFMSHLPKVVLYMNLLTY